VWIRRDGSHEFVCCRKLTTEEATAENEAQRQRLEEIRSKLKGQKPAKQPQSKSEPQPEPPTT
jgi:hypothetical protein